MNLTIRQLRYFVATAENAQVSRAALELAVSQSAVTTAIRAIETQLGCKLFKRLARGMVITSQGRDFLAAAYRVLSTMDDAARSVVTGSDVAGELKVAATYTVMGYFLPYHIERLKRQHPRLTIKLIEMSRAMIEEALATDRVDISLLLTSNVAAPELITEPLLQSTRRLWLPSGHPLLAAEQVGIADISKEPYIMLTVDEAAQTTMRYWSKTPFQPQIELRTSSIEAVRSLVANGQGLTILSDMVYRPWSLEGKRIETMVPVDPVPAMELGLAWRRGHGLSPQMQAFVDYHRATFQTPQRSLNIDDE